MKTLFKAWSLCLLAACLFCATAHPMLQAGSYAIGPLRIHPSNPRYFSDSTRADDGSTNAVYLAGSHTWNSLQDPPEGAFDYPAFLSFLQQHNHNFFRLWIRMGTGGGPVPTPTIYPRKGPGKANDGGLKYNLKEVNPEFVKRLRERVMAAGSNGIYVAVILFGGDNVEFRGGNENWPFHPYHRANNIHNIDGDPNNDNQGLECHNLKVPEVTRLQEEYVKTVVDTLGDLPNVLWEVGNELVGGHEFSVHMARYIKDYERSRNLGPHPIGISTYGDSNPSMAALLKTPADWITPDMKEGDYQNDPPAATGEKVIISDTDHLWGVGGNESWVWKSFFRGLHPIYMDPMTYEESHQRARKAMGQTRQVSMKVNLGKAVPSGNLSSTKYCLANPGKEYLVYQPEGGKSFTVDIIPGSYNAEWFNASSDTFLKSSIIRLNEKTSTFSPPFNDPAVLLLGRRAE